MWVLAAAVNPAPLWDQACVPQLSAALVTSSERKGRAIPMTVSCCPHSHEANFSPDISL